MSPSDDSPDRPEPSESAESLRAWEALAVSAVGHVIEFWNFKRNHGRIWALLYLRDRAMSAAELQETLELSKGAVSMLIRELEQWRVIERVRDPRDSVWRYGARTDLMKMITRVLSRRENDLVARVQTELREAERLARASGEASPLALERIRRMRQLAELVGGAITTLIRTATLDVRGLIGMLAGGVARRGGDSHDDDTIGSEGGGGDEDLD